MKFFSPSLGLRVFFALFILILAFPAARAQSTQGTINGVITDQAGAVIAHASVDVTNEATGVTVHTTTNEAGKYNVPALNIGTYTVSVDEKGFGRYTRAGLTLSTDQILGVDAQLKSGTVDQNVTITSSAPELETRTSSIGQTIEAKSVSELPLGNRTSMNIVALTGGAVFIDSANYSLSGGRTKSSMTWLDGGSGQNIRIGIGTAEVSPPVDTVQEIGVISNNYGAEFGGSAGGIVIQNTKSGTNGFHGSLYEFLPTMRSMRPVILQASRTVPRSSRNSVTTSTAAPSVAPSATIVRSSFSGMRVLVSGPDRPSR